MTGRRRQAGTRGIHGNGGLPRIVAIMGSGETTPTMVKVHRMLLDRVGPPPVPAVLIDTPYGFQENASDISARTVEYFHDSVGAELEVASLRSADVDALTHDTAVARIRTARYVFAGPGSPSYALRHWRATEIPGLVADKIAKGGVVTFASAAALTLGVVTIPVYEIYKVGDDPRWLPGLDLLTAIGLRVAVIPHYDNAEGGNHDTRFCYLGERRLRMLEEQLPDDTFVLGVDSHTALVLDLDAGSAEILGLGGVTVRRGGQSRQFPAGSTLAIDDLRAATEAVAGKSPAPEAAHATSSGDVSPRDGEDIGAGERTPLVAEVDQLERSFDDGLASGDVEQAVGAILELDRTIIDWSRDTGLAEDFDRARSLLRSLVVRLGDLAVDGTRDPREVVGPFVDALLELRVRAREDRDWSAADGIRDRLVAAGIELHDSPDGTTWEVAGRSNGRSA